MDLSSHWIKAGLVTLLWLAECGGWHAALSHRVKSRNPSGEILQRERDHCLASLQLFPPSQQRHHDLWAKPSSISSSRRISRWLQPHEWVQVNPVQIAGLWTNIWLLFKPLNLGSIVMCNRLWKHGVFGIQWVFQLSMCLIKFICRRLDG